MGPTATSEVGYAVYYEVSSLNYSEGLYWKYVVDPGIQGSDSWIIIGASWVVILSVVIFSE